MAEPKPFRWSERKARWYLRAEAYNDYPVALLKVILPLLKGCRSVVDVGAGCGAFTLALARVLPQITAVEPAPAMAALLRERVERAGLTNVRLIEAPFQEADLDPHDAVLSAFVHEAHAELERFMPWVERVAKGRVVLTRAARREEDKLFLGELSRLTRGAPPARRGDYLETVVRLHERGVFPNVRMVEFRLDQPFDDLAEAVEFWREYLELEDDRHDEALGAFLGERLVAVEGSLVAPVRTTSAVLWWDLS